MIDKEFFNKNRKNIFWFGIIVLLIIIIIIIIIYFRNKSLEINPQNNNPQNNNPQNNKMDEEQWGRWKEWDKKCGNGIYKLTRELENPNKPAYAGNSEEKCITSKGCYKYGSDAFKLEYPELVSLDKCYEIAYNYEIINYNNDLSQLNMFGIKDYNQETKLGKCLYGKYIPEKVVNTYDLINKINPSKYGKSDKCFTDMINENYYGDSTSFGLYSFNKNLPTQFN